MGWVWVVIASRLTRCISVRESPALAVIDLLLQKGAQVEYHDPYIPHLCHDGWDMDSVPDLMGSVAGADAVLVVTDHKVYDYGAIVEEARFVFDAQCDGGDGEI